MRKEYITTLTPLRGIAALLVVIFHSNLMGMPFLPFDKHTFIQACWLWVDFFFVLSGFIMFYVYGNAFETSVTTSHYWKYIKARFARIYPLHFVTLMVAVVFAIVIRNYATGFAPFFDDMLNPMAAFPSLFLIQSLGFYVSAPLNTPSWSLSTEWWVYVVFPFFVPFFMRMRTIGKWIALILIVTLFLFVKYYLGPRAEPFPGGPPTINVISDFGIFRCVAGFLLGMLVYRMYDEKIGHRFFSQSWVFVLFFLSTLVLMHINAEDILVVTLFPFVIISAACNTTTIKQFFDLTPLQKLGDWSFSIYMVHVPLISILWIYQVQSRPDMFASFPPIPSAPPDYTAGLIFCTMIVVATLVVASLTYAFIEVPARKYLNQRFAAGTAAVRV